MLDGDTRAPTNGELVRLEELEPTPGPKGKLHRTGRKVFQDLRTEAANTVKLELWTQLTITIHC